MVLVEGVHVTTPLRTSLDLGRLLPVGRALGAMDALLGTGSFTHTQLLAELPRMAGCPGVGQLRLLAPQVDARAAGPAESVLRLHWNEARLPRRSPACPSRLEAGWCASRWGWTVASSGRCCSVGSRPTTWWPWRGRAGGSSYCLRSGCSTGDPVSWTKHLEREFHQQLLAQTG